MGTPVYGNPHMVRSGQAWMVWDCLGKLETPKWLKSWYLHENWDPMKSRMKVDDISCCFLRIDQSSGEISNHYNIVRRITLGSEWIWRLFIFCWLHIQPLMPWACSRQKTQWPLQMLVTPQCRTKDTRSLAIDTLDAHLRTVSYSICLTCLFGNPCWFHLA